MFGVFKLIFMKARRILKAIDRAIWKKRLDRIFSSSRLFNRIDLEIISRRRRECWDRQLRYRKYKRKFNNKYLHKDEL